MDFIQLLAGTKYSPFPQNAWIVFEANTVPTSLGTRVISVEVKRGWSLKSPAHLHLALSLRIRTL